MNKERENIEFFKPSDFEIWHENNVGRKVRYEIGGEHAADKANKLLEQALGPKVYGVKAGNAGLSMTETYVSSDTHTAFLFNVREIVKECEHEPIHVVIALSTEQTIEVKEDAIKLVCSKCNKKLTAKWTVAE